MGLNDRERVPLYREHRRLLRNGQWRRVVDELTAIAADEPGDSKVWTEINYLRKHGEAGRLKYPTFKVWACRYAVAPLRAIFAA